MAIRKYDPETNTYKELTDREIKKEIMKTLGLDPENPDDQKIYRRQYDVLRKRVKNYSSTTGIKTPIRVNELFLRIQQRKLSDKELTAQQQNIINTTSINTGTFSQRAESNPDPIRRQGIANLEREFSGLLNKYTKGRNEYYAWLETPVKRQYIDIITGEVLKRSQLKGKKKNIDYMVETFTNRDIATPQQVKAKLISIADELHSEQNKLLEAYKNNKKLYKKLRSELY